MSKSNNLPVWDLSAYYKSIDDPKVEMDLAESKRGIFDFVKIYKRKITNNIRADFLLKALQSYEKLFEEIGQIIFFASNIHAVESNNPKAGAFYQKALKSYYDIRGEVIFFELALSKLDDAVLQKFIKHEKLTNYAHYLEKVLATKKHRLSEKEERIFNDKAITSSNAVIRFFDEHFARRKFEVKINGKIKQLNEPGTLELLHDSNRQTRKAAAEAFSRGLKEDQGFLSLVFNTIAEDKAIGDKYAKFESPEAARHLDNEVTQQMVDTMSLVVEQNCSLVQKFYKLKKEILGYQEMFDYDRYAPIAETEKKLGFEKAKKLVLKTFYDFSPVFGDAAKKFFDKNWIHAPILPGKRGGAYCSYGEPAKHPVILLNYTGTLENVSTLAHELGHGVNAYLMRKQTALNFDTPLVLAETASVFAEMLLFENLKKELKDEKEIFALYIGKLERIIATVHRQISMYRFEQNFHIQKIIQGEIPALEINQIWRKTQERMFGKSVTITSNYDMWWSYIPHFLHAPFYVYAYSFGELLVLSLYAQYKREGEKFVKKYLKLMQAGSIDTPQNLLQPFGIDLKDRKFWEGGIKIIEDLFKEAKRLYK